MVEQLDKYHVYYMKKQINKFAIFQLSVFPSHVQLGDCTNCHISQIFWGREYRFSSFLKWAVIPEIEEDGAEL